MSEIVVVPQPVKVVRTEGSYTLPKKAKIYADPSAGPVAMLLEMTLRGAITLTAAVDTPGHINLILDDELSDLGDEGYQLSVTTEGITARAAKAQGLIWAVQTLRQLLPADGSGVIPCVEIEDYPRFAWRGAMLDVGRHFFPKQDVLRFIDGLVLHKLNVCHLHLTEDQGWRVEIKRYPKLTEVGAWREKTVIGRVHSEDQDMAFDEERYGGFYTQDDLREIVAYAAFRGITVVPEIEMPGHAQAAVASYPELGNTGESPGVRPYWGISKYIYNPKDSTIEFLQNVLDEVLEIFPSEFIHIGGDEAPKDQWEASPVAQAKIEALGLKDAHELQSWFIRQMDAYLTSKGRRLIGWDEILEGGLAENATVMSWRGDDGGIAAAMSGHDVVMAPTHSTYLDYYQSEDRESEPLAIGGFLPLDKVYAFDPYCEGIDEAHQHHVLGGQGQLWTEYIGDIEHVEYMAYPRLCALAEAVWSEPGTRDYTDFVVRLTTHLPRLDAEGMNYRDIVRR